MPRTPRARMRLPIRWWRRILIFIRNCLRWYATVWRRRKVEASLTHVRQFLFLTGLAVLAPGFGLAQVVVNQAALRQLAGIAAPPPVQAVAQPPTRVAAHVAAPAHHRVPAKHEQVAVAAPKPPQAKNPPAPGPAAAHVVAPIAPKPVASKPVPPRQAPPAASVALVFGAGSATLPANAGTVLKPYCTSPDNIVVNARAPADPSDPSAAMRLSLSRAMAVQGALTACGVPPQHILPRALGAVPGQNEDETMIGGAQ